MTDSRARLQLPIHHNGLPAPQRHWAITALALAIVMAVLDGTLINVALPAIAHELNVEAKDSVWLINAYQLTIVATLLPFAALGERLGYRPIYLGGLLVFVLASLACSFANNMPLLTAARVLQGFGAAAIMSINAALVRFVYPQHLLGRGIGIIALSVAVAAASGPTVAAAILAMADWHWLFAINIPFGVFALIVGWRSLPATPRSPHPFDMGSALLSALMFILIISAVDNIGHSKPWSWIIPQFCAGLLLGSILVRRQLQQPSPLLPVDLLRIPIFALSIGTSVCSFAAQMLAYVSIPFYLHDTLQRSAVDTGLLMTPWPLMVAVTAPIAGRLADRYSAGLLGGIGMTIFACGMAALALLPETPSDLSILWRMALCGIGFGLFQSPNNRTIMVSAPRNRSGGASGMLGTGRLLGQTLGTALVALLFGLAPAHGTALALGLGAILALLAAVVSSSRHFVPLPTHN